MKEERVRHLLLSVPVPDELETLRRNWRVVRAAYEREERPSPRDRYIRPALALAAVAALLAAALSPPGRAVGGWLREAVRERVGAETPARPALGSLPARGRLLVVSPRGAWIVQRDGSKRRLGAYDDASWSPRGLFVVGARGRQLVALEPDGDIRWSLARSRPIAAPRWAPSGFRIAYRSGRTLRVVAGDGSPDRLLARRIAPVAAAWRPGQRNVLAYVDARGRVRVVDVDSRRVLWRVRGLEARPRELVWSADGSRLAAVAPAVLYVLGGQGRVLTSMPPPLAAARFLTAAFAPRGRSLAVATRHMNGRSAVVVLRADRLRPRPRSLFAGAGVFSDLAWSPNGRWLLVAWRNADQWLFIRTPGVRKVVAVSNISRQFDPAGAGPARFPRLAGWCCPQ